MVEVDNANGLVATTALARAAMTRIVGSTTNHLVRIETRDVLIPETPEPFTYDLDGNLTADGLWTYTWDGENRLVAVESRSGVPAAFRKRLSFQYDHQSRRTYKTVESDDSTGTYTITNAFTFVYDGWNLV